jgi:hypothetical protein
MYTCRYADTPTCAHVGTLRRWLLPRERFSTELPECPSQHNIAKRGSQELSLIWRLTPEVFHLVASHL